MIEGPAEESWQVFDGLDHPAWADCVTVRDLVFVRGQDCPWNEEFDGVDPLCRHLLVARQGHPVATSRWRRYRDPFSPSKESETSPEPPAERWMASSGFVAKLERFAVVPSARGTGLGRKLVHSTIEDARHFGHRVFLIHAQAHLESFYTAMGFGTEGDRFVEAGIDHLRMRLTSTS